MLTHIGEGGAILLTPKTATTSRIEIVRMIESDEKGLDSSRRKVEGIGPSGVRYDTQGEIPG